MLPASPASPALPVAAPQCPSHPGRASSATCARCGRFACHECAGHADLCVDCDRLTLPSAAGRARWASRFLTVTAVCMGSMAAVQLVALLAGQSLDDAAQGSLGLAAWMGLSGIGTVLFFVQRTVARGGPAVRLDGARAAAPARGAHRGLRRSPGGGGANLPRAPGPHAPPCPAPSSAPRARRRGSVSVPAARPTGPASAAASVA